MQGLVLAGCAEEPVTVRLVLHEGGAVDQRLRRVPDNVADRLLRVDPATRHPGQNTLLECTETCYYTAACLANGFFIRRKNSALILHEVFQGQ